MSCTRSNPPNGYTAENRTSTTLQNRTTSPALERAMVTIAHQDNVLQPTNKLTYLTALKDIYNRVLKTGQFSTTWCKTIIHPIFKNGDADNPHNYRGIALLSNLAKLFSSILKIRLSNWTENRAIIPENQAISLIQLTLRRKRRKFYDFFIDLKKAFDTVPQALLWKKLIDIMTAAYNVSAFVVKTGSTTQWQADLAPKEMAASDMRNRHHVQLLLTWSTDAAHPVSGALTGYYQPGLLSPDFIKIRKDKIQDDTAIYLRQE
ncbi:hypothetical protein LAZ67_9002605 [Cordylochernes scorpioides]|uniref:Reverse transcriptase domain-containing protein n=1 Tax=Cordylochernes scorpioides TaxID=51811 RepID=A0ABY6KVY1_9ARAC|nr:hypothetical protein LAZ67_9002605 [Cordylochernes scorpioides]